MSRYEKYQQARKEYLKNKERQANDYHREACRATYKAASHNRKQSQKYV